MYRLQVSTLRAYPSIVCHTLVRVCVDIAHSMHPCDICPSVKNAPFHREAGDDHAGAPQRIMKMLGSQLLQAASI